MTRDHEDDPLSWGDEGDPTYLEEPSERGRPTEPAASPTAATRSPGGNPPKSPRLSRAERRGSGSAAGARANSNPVTDVGADANDTDDDDTAAPPISSILLVTIGILAGVYLLYTVGWLVTAQRTMVIPVDALDAVMARLRIYLAIAAPALWFAAAFLLTRGRKPILRLVWLLVGVIVLVPIPFVIGS